MRILIGIARLKSCADRNASIVWSRMERTTRRVGSDSSFARDTRCRSSKRPQSLLNQYLVYIVAWNRTLATDTRHRYHAANKVTKTATRPSRINSSIRHWEKFRSNSRLLSIVNFQLTSHVAYNNWKVLFLRNFFRLELIVAFEGEEGSF